METLNIWCQNDECGAHFPVELDSKIEGDTHEKECPKCGWITTFEIIYVIEAYHLCAEKKE